MIKQEVRGDSATLTFVLPSDTTTGKVSVVGDFNEWTPGVHTLVKRSNGTRSVKVAVPAGTAYRFRYLGEDGNWFDDPHVEHRDWQNGLVLT
ncbi:MAG TPA: isoamylase early set domain-containing protein [Nocardioidaceae bacterium]|nr:isoamylase early set domain-containing protein [Nocardioidaceae bacterium]